MPIIEFPPIHLADESGLLAIGGDLSVESLTLSYSQGIFPWPIDEEYPLAWFSPPLRGVINVEQLSIGRTLKKNIKKTSFDVKFNCDFEKIIHLCRQTRAEAFEGTWITDEIIEGYIGLHKAGKAYCVGVYEDDKLVGGLYGVCFGNFLSGESMFYLTPNASKVALFTLLANLKINGIKYYDTQMVTSITKAFGAKEIKRSDFILYVNDVFNQSSLDFKNFNTNVHSLLMNF